MKATTDRKQDEADFHDRREQLRRDLPRGEFEKTYSNGKFYSIARREARFLEKVIAGLPPGAVALDYCCGPGSMSLRLAKAGLTVHGIDISADSIRGTTALLEREGVGDRGHFQVMDAENLTFPDAMFDLIICSGVLHHLDVNNAYPNLARVLKPGGKIYCLEALGYNPLFHLYRKLTPQLRTAWEVDHILTLREVNLARRYFGKVDVSFLYLAVLAAVPFRNTIVFDSLLRALDAVDEVVLRVPGLQRMAWQMVFLLSDPKR